MDSRLSYMYVYWHYMIHKFASQPLLQKSGSGKYRTILLVPGRVHVYELPMTEGGCTCVQILHTHGAKISEEQASFFQPTGCQRWLCWSRFSSKGAKQMSDFSRSCYDHLSLVIATNYTDYLHYLIGVVGLSYLSLPK